MLQFDNSILSKIEMPFFLLRPEIDNKWFFFAKRLMYSDTKGCYSMLCDIISLVKLVKQKNEKTNPLCVRRQVWSFAVPAFRTTWPRCPTAKRFPSTSTESRSSRFRRRHRRCRLLFRRLPVRRRRRQSQTLCDAEWFRGRLQPKMLKKYLRNWTFR